MKRLMGALPMIALLSACGLTAQQRAAREAQRAEEERELAIALAKRCDGETAELMRLAQSNWLGVAEADKARLAVEFQQRYQSPVFQSCYQMAWENLRYRQHLDYLEQRDWHREMLWRNHPAFYSPFWW